MPRSTLGSSNVTPPPITRWKRAYQAHCCPTALPRARHEYANNWSLRAQAPPQRASKATDHHRGGAATSVPPVHTHHTSTAASHVQIAGALSFYPGPPWTSYRHRPATRSRCVRRGGHTPSPRQRRHLGQWQLPPAWTAQTGAGRGARHQPRP